MVLLVWGDIPYWTVVDKEFESLLLMLDGELTLGEIISKNPSWYARKKEITANIGVLRGAGVFTSAKTIPKFAPPLYGTKLESVAINITRQCNLRCRYCYLLDKLTASDDNELTAGEINGFLQQIRPFVSKKPLLTILGGEPLMDTGKLLAVAEQAIRQSFTVLVSTNGIKVTDDFAQRAAQLGIQMQVSLDGHTPALHDAIRGRGSFEGAVAGVRKLVRHNVHTIISMVCHQGNVDHLLDYYRFARELGVKGARFIPLKRMGGAAGGEFIPVPMDQLLHQAFIMFSQHPELLPLAGNDTFNIMANTCKYSMRRASCGTALQTVLLDANGDIFPCLNCNFADAKIANIRDAGFDFRRSWLTSPALLDFRSATVLAEGKDEHKGCPVRYWCLGGCRGENRVLTGSLSKRPPHCAELRQATLAMFWVLAEHPELIKSAVKMC